MIPLALVLQRHWPEYQKKFGEQIPASHRRAVKAILQCRTPALGGQRFSCQHCGRDHFVYHSCNHRACPQCGQADALEWVDKQTSKLLPAPYFLVTFTVPEELRALIRSHPRKLFSCLFKESAGTLMEIAANPKHLGAELGLLGVLHTWSRQLVFHPHIHYVVTGGGLTSNGLRWKRFKNPKFFLPAKVLAARFRNRLKHVFREAGFQTDKQTWKRGWVVDVQAVGNGAAALKYLAHYVYRTALSSQNILKDQNNRITFSYRQSDSGRRKILTVSATEFIRRFLQHVLPTGFQRVRYFGWMAAAASKRFARIRALLDWQPSAPSKEPKPPRAPFCKTCELKMILTQELPRAP